MYQHHLDSIEKMKEYFRPTEGIIALVLGGSVAKGNERPDSDLTPWSSSPQRPTPKSWQRAARQSACLATAPMRAATST